jgi:hypothetical protein
MGSNNAIPPGNGLIISNRTLSHNDTAEQVDRYIDSICSDPKFLCENKELCGKNTTIYSNVENVNTICDNIKTANDCENNFKECVVLANNNFDASNKYVSTSFSNIIIPIPNAIDSEGNNKFLRLPPLSGTKKENSIEICNICNCMNRFATAPGSGNINTNTSPGQNTCVYNEHFEYFYYPVAIEHINDKLHNPPEVKVGKYRVINSNIIPTITEENLSVSNLYDLLLKNDIQELFIVNFISNVLYPQDQTKKKELEIYRLSKKSNIKEKNAQNAFYSNISFVYILIAVLIALLLLNLF